MKKFSFYLFLFAVSCFFSICANADVLDNYSNVPNKTVCPENWSNDEIIHLIAEASDVKLYSISSAKDKYISSKVIVKIGGISESFNWECLNYNFTMPNIYELGSNKNGERLIAIKIHSGSSKMFPKDNLHILTVSNNKIVDYHLDCLSIAQQIKGLLDITYDEYYDTIILSSGFQKLIFSGSNFMHAHQSLKLCPISNIVEFSIECEKVFIHFTVPITSYKKCAVEFIAKVSAEVDILDNNKLTNIHLSPFVQAFKQP